MNEKPSDSNTTPAQIEPDPKELIALANYRMPYGKYKGRFLIDLPEAYVVWFARKGFPKNKLGRLLQGLYDIKLKDALILNPPLVLWPEKRVNAALPADVIEAFQLADIGQKELFSE